MEEDGRFWFFVVIFIIVLVFDFRQEYLASVKLAPFYQKDKILVLVVIDQKQRSEGVALARELIAAEYTPIYSSQSMSDVVVSVDGDSFTVAPIPFFCRDGRYAEISIPALHTETPSEVIEFIEVIQKERAKACALTVESLKKLI